MQNTFMIARASPPGLEDNGNRAVNDNRVAARTRREQRRSPLRAASNCRSTEALQRAAKCCARSHHALACSTGAGLRRAAATRRRETPAHGSGWGGPDRASAWMCTRVPHIGAKEDVVPVCVPTSPQAQWEAGEGEGGRGGFGHTWPISCPLNCLVTVMAWVYGMT